jgi:hypothetical protein
VIDAAKGSFGDRPVTMIQTLNLLVIEFRAAKIHSFAGLGAYLLQLLTDHCHPNPCRYKGGWASAPSASLTIRGLNPTQRVAVLTRGGFSCRQSLQFRPQLTVDMATVQVTGTEEDTD